MRHASKRPRRVLARPTRMNAAVCNQNPLPARAKSSATTVSTCNQPANPLHTQCIVTCPEVLHCPEGVQAKSSEGVLEMLTSRSPREQSAQR